MHRWGLRSWTSRPPRTRRSRWTRARTRRSRRRSSRADIVVGRRRRTLGDEAFYVSPQTSGGYPSQEGHRRRSNPRATTGITDGNRTRDDVDLAAQLAPLDSAAELRASSSRWATRSRTKTSDDGETKAAAGWRDCGWSSGCARRTANRSSGGKRARRGIEPATIRRETRDAGSGPRLTPRQSRSLSLRARLRDDGDALTELGSERRFPGRRRTGDGLDPRYPTAPA